MKRHLSAAIALLVMGAWCAAAGATMPAVTLQSLKGSYEDAKERVVAAIENRGLVIDHTANVGGMLERTGKDIGRDRQLYLKAEVIEFCSAAVSRTTMEADPRNLVFCPYGIALYVLPGEPDKVYVIYRKPLATGSARSMKALREIGKLLDGIARDALK